MGMPSSGRETLRSVALLGLFLASGCSALIYEVVWFHQLGLVLGATAVSLAMLLASFMGGMCLGSFGFSHCVSARRHPLRVYAVLELLIAACGVSTLWLFPVVGRVYCHFSLMGSGDLVVRSLMAMLLLLPPTAMMGATLPAVARWVQSNRTGMAWIGWLYGANTIGAMIGCLLAGMYLLRLYDVFVATYVAAAINVAVAALALQLARRETAGAMRPVVDPGLPDLVVPLSGQGGGDTVWNLVTADERPDQRTPLSRSIDLAVVLFVAGLSGFAALGAEVVWTRHLGLLLGPTVYTFSIILAVFLLGLGLGSGVGAWIGHRARSPRLALAMTQLLLMLAIPYAAYLIVHVLPRWLVLRGSGELFTVRMTRDVLRTLLALLPATVLWGASFPLAVAVLAGHDRDPSRLVGRLCAANTLGAILGSLGVSLFAITYGGQFVQQLLTLVSGLAGILMLGLMAWQNRHLIKRVPFQLNEVVPRLPGLISLTILAIVCPFAFCGIPATPHALLAEGRSAHRWDDSSSYLYVAEGLDSSIVVSDLQDGTRCFHVAGKIEASTRERDLRTQRLLGHLPALAHPLPRKVLVVGCGSGMTAGSFLLYPTVEQIVLCEMEKCVIEAARENFEAYNYGVLRDPATRIVCDDARHFLATTRESFDIITIDPIHPWVKGAAALYTVEFFELCKSHLNRNGLVTLWVPLYESNEATVKCELATFLQQFPQTMIWSGQSLHVGYDLIVVGSVDGQPGNVQEMTSRLSSSPSLQKSFAEIGLTQEDSLTSRFAASGHDLKSWLRGAEINRDRNLRLQYLAGTNPDDAQEQWILQSMICARDGALEKSTPTVTVLAADQIELDDAYLGNRLPFSEEEENGLPFHSTQQPR